MVNQWIEHVKKYAKQNNLTYACAIPDAVKTYVKKTKEPGKKETSERVKDMEYELNQTRKNIDAVDVRRALQQVLGKPRGVNNQKKRLEMYKYQYGKQKEELEKMTGKQYPSLPTAKEEKQSEKRVNAQLKLREIELEKNRKMNVKKNDYDLSLYRKKKSGVVI